MQMNMQYMLFVMGLSIGFFVAAFKHQKADLKKLQIIQAEELNVSV